MKASKSDQESGQDSGVIHNLESERTDKVPLRGVYLIPNLITTGALFSGFYAIVAAMDGHFIAAALAIYAAGILDALDGPMARMTHTESPFGAQYDSLSDMVAFGVAPALVAFSWSLSVLGRIGWVVTFIYMACAALRLARYNIQTEHKSFTGLASPSAAGIVASTVWIMSEYYAPGEVVSRSVASATAIITVLAGLLMASNFEYLSWKVFNFKGRVPFLAMLAVVLIFAVILWEPPRVLLTLGVCYAASGPLRFVWEKKFKPRREASH